MIIVKLVSFWGNEKEKWNGGNDGVSRKFTEIISWFYIALNEINIVAFSSVSQCIHSFWENMRVLFIIIDYFVHLLIECGLQCRHCLYFTVRNSIKYFINSYALIAANRAKSLQVSEFSYTFYVYLVQIGFKIIR